MIAARYSTPAAAGESADIFHPFRGMKRRTRVYDLDKAELCEAIEALLKGDDPDVRPEDLLNANAGLVRPELARRLFGERRLLRSLVESDDPDDALVKAGRVETTARRPTRPDGTIEKSFEDFGEWLEEYRSTR